ncbi:unnamed protein product [Cyclocybe aegerita]|uniref:F-box domain-containing protein n=1 Tax=Cyclocybe aegerita TaxID=1973307 RepID=A0A8S0WHB5_CYCAE|nr:unnamed protein product [Cyclocybe aegerita]
MPNRYVVQRPALPWEITDAIIDHLHSDIRALGTCSAVCSEWLIRSRHHIFSTIQLWPWRARRFFELASRSSCTFTHYVSRIEVDDSRGRSNSPERRSQTPGLGNEAEVPFSEAMAQSHIPCLAQVTSIQVRNVDWTALSPVEQTTLRGHLAQFSKLDRLEFHDVTFHDLREVVRIVDAFPSIRHLTANIAFMKYLEHTIASASTLCLSSNLRSLELGTEDGIPVVLSSVTSTEALGQCQELSLKNIRANHLQYIRTMLRKARMDLQRLSLGFSRESDLSNAIDLSRLGNLRALHIEGLNIPGSDCFSAVEESLPSILQRIESSFLEAVELQFRLQPQGSLQCIEWRRLERVFLALHFFGMGLVRVTIHLGHSVTNECEAEVEKRLRDAMSELNARGVLQVPLASKA